MLGEKLLIKLWETLTDKGIGSLLEPWHKSRLHDVDLKAKCKEIIMIADAEKKANDIKNGKLQIIDSEKLTFTSVDEISTYIESVQKVENIKKEVNVAKAIVYAEQELENDTTEVPEEEIDEDWLYKWKNNASEVSKEELQRMWGSVLAGEVKSPGKYSLRTMEFLKNISLDEAKLIENIGQFVINNFILYESGEVHILDKYHLTFGKLLRLQEIGILIGVDSENVATQYTSDSKIKYSKTLISNNRVLVISKHNAAEKITSRAICISQLGIQVLSLNKYKFNEEYLQCIGKRFVKNGFNVEIGDYTLINEKEFQVQNRQIIEL